MLGIGSTPVPATAWRCAAATACSTRTACRRSYQDDVDFAIETDQPEIVALATDGNELPALVVGAPSVKLAFAYPPGTVEPVELTPPDPAPESYGSVVAAWTSGRRAALRGGGPDGG